MSVPGARIDVLILACAISAGIHAALVRSHLEEGLGPGAGFAASTVLLGIVAVVLTRNPTPAGVAASALVFAGLIGAYALATTTGLPVLHPEQEAVDGLGLFTKAVEAVGLVTAASLLPRPSPGVALHLKGTLT